MDDYKTIYFRMAEVDRRLNVVTAQRDELLEALEAVLPELRGLAIMSNEAGILVGICETAIAKAKGEQ